MKKDMTGIILAGGKNSRMGTNKAFLEINGIRLIDNILAIYQNIFSEIIIVTNDPLSYTEFSDTIIVTDIYKEKGALGGIYTGLFYATFDYSFVAACDMPFLNEDFIIYLTGQANNKHDIIVPQLPEGFQPLHAIYSKNCLSHINKLLSVNKLKIAGFYKEVRLFPVAEESIKPFNKDGRLFLNINTPEDLKKEQKGPF
ncbi:MAG: molybdenum cofactor guanylyltransferase [Deltaproteobacteria bacterium HGW-Deltaproteobacteria-10]|nr:MAG: molybdenum cofactor guanylyltransferase [Deltaproteobacteria bacterium HGW-Deltaproteobacteria-10]